MWYFYQYKWCDLRSSDDGEPKESQSESEMEGVLHPTFLLKKRNDRGGKRIKKKMAETRHEPP